MLEHFKIDPALKMYTTWDLCESYKFFVKLIDLFRECIDLQAKEGVQASIYIKD